MNISINMPYEQMFYDAMVSGDVPLHCTMKSSNEEDVTVLEEGKDYMIKTEDRNEDVALGILILAAILSIGGFIALVSMFVKHL